jgi:hypothetical protein
MSLLEDRRCFFWEETCSMSLSRKSDASFQCRGKEIARYGPRKSLEDDYSIKPLLLKGF